MKKDKYPQDEEKNEYRYISPSWLDEIACGLTAGAEKHPGETWKIFRRTSIFPGLCVTSIYIAWETGTNLISSMRACA